MIPRTGLRVAALVLLCGTGSLCCGQQAAPSTDSALARDVAALLADPAVTHAHWGIAVTTLDGKPVYSLDAGKLFRPSSNAKLFTTAAAMALLGPNATVTTQAYFPPPSPDGIVAGDLTLVGSSDALSTQEIPYVHRTRDAAPASDHFLILDELSEKVAKAGVTHITGNIVASDYQWEPYPQGWGTDDLLWGYGAPVASLSLDDNQILLTVMPTEAPHPADVTLTPDLGFYKVVSTARTADGAGHAGIAVHREADSRDIIVEGSVAKGHPYSTYLAVGDPPAYAVFALRQRLIARGITVDGESVDRHEFHGNPDNFLQESGVATLKKTPAGAVNLLRGAVGDYFGTKPLFVTHISPTLADDVTLMLKESQNLHAELLLRRLSRVHGPTGMYTSTYAQGAKVVRQFLLDAGLDATDFLFYDGSGLSTKDLVTPRATAQLLAYAATQPWFAQWKAALPVGGVDGTLAERFKEAPLKGHVFAKTGTLGESRALSGYVDCASGKQVIFSIFVDNHAPGSSADRAVMDKIVAAIAAKN